MPSVFSILIRYGLFKPGRYASNCDLSKVLMSAFFRFSNAAIVPFTGYQILPSGLSSPFLVMFFHCFSGSFSRLIGLHSLPLPLKMPLPVMATFFKPVPLINGMTLSSLPVFTIGLSLGSALNTTIAPACK